MWLRPRWTPLCSCQGNDSSHCLGRMHPCRSVIKNIITFAFYMPPRSRMKSKMNDHIVTTLHQLLNTFPEAGIMGGGDRNDWNIEQILPAIPRLQNLQNLPTLNGKNLDVLISNLGAYYSNPVVGSASSGSRLSIPREEIGPQCSNYLSTE